jgi:hypothetical protein
MSVGSATPSTTMRTMRTMRRHRPIATFSEHELREYACEHVLYEITHFVRAVQALDAARVGRFPMNSAIELFALHLRNLLDFFAPRSMRPTDACARHFHAKWESPKLNSSLTEARWMADKQIAHLTTDRTADMSRKTWAVVPIVQSVIPIIERFTEGADTVCDEFRQHVRERLAELPTVGDSNRASARANTAQGSLVAPIGVLRAWDRRSGYPKVSRRAAGSWGSDRPSRMSDTGPIQDHTHFIGQTRVRSSRSTEQPCSRCKRSRTRSAFSMPWRTSILRGIQT